MNHVVDSSGWIEYFTRGANAEFFLPAIRDTDHLFVPTIIFYEVFKHVLLHVDEESALQAAAVMSQANEVELDRNIALDAALISVENKLAMADSIILATARANNATLWTQDAHFQQINDVRYIEKR
jgi:toxin FitB